MIVTATTAAHIHSLQAILDRTGLFPSEMLPDMLRTSLANPQNRELWLTCESDGEIIGFCYAAAEAITDGTWNMLAIAVHPDRQGSGAGTAMAAALESRLRELGQRLLIADTSGTSSYSRTRQFYRNNGYLQEAVIRDFWGEGDDKVTFWKSLQ